MATWTKTCGSCGRSVDFNSKCPCQIVKDQQRRKRKNEADVEATKFYKSTKWKKFRKTIINRDKHYCQRCLIKYNIITGETETMKLEVHHIKARSIYDGTNGYDDLRYTPMNCITLCKSCNTQLGTKGELDFPFTFPEEKSNGLFAI